MQDNPYSHRPAPPAPVIDPIWLPGGHALMNTDAAFSPLDSSVPAGRSGRHYWRTGIETGGDMMRMTETKTPNASASNASLTFPFPPFPSPFNTPRLIPSPAPFSQGHALRRWSHSSPPAVVQSVA